MTTRAAKGGEYGANGEWYEGGKFINTVPENAKKEGSRKKKMRKVEIEPYKWVLAEPNKTSIYAVFAGVFGRIIDGAAVVNVSTETLRHFGRTIEEVESMAHRYNAGERWM